METWKKNVENMENAQKALKYAIKSFYFLKKHVFYTPKSSQCSSLDCLKIAFLVPKACNDKKQKNKKS